MVSPVSLPSSVMEGHRILRSIQDFRNLPKASDSSGSWRIQAATVCRVGGSKTLAAERREVEGQPRILPPASQSFPIRKEKRASPVRACIFGAAGALRLFGLRRFFKRGDGKGRKARSAQPVSRTRKGITDMGIFVNLAISTSVTQDEWTSVYEESLRGNKRSSDPRKTGSKRPESASRAGSLPRDPLTQWGRK